MDTNLSSVIGIVMAAMNIKAKRSQGNIDLNSSFGLLTKYHLIKISPDITRHILNESKASVIGIAIKKGINLVNNKADSSRENDKTKAANKTVNGIITTRGKIPSATRNTTTKPIKNVISSDLFNFIYPFFICLFPSKFIWY